MEKDDDWYGAGNEYTTEFRQLDVRTGRWMSMDPMMAVVPDRSPYEFAFNNPVAFVDPSGLLPSGKGGGSKPPKDQNGNKPGKVHKGDYKLGGKNPEGSGGGDNSSGGGGSGGSGIDWGATFDKVSEFATKAANKTSEVIEKSQQVVGNYFAEEFNRPRMSFEEYTESRTNPTPEAYKEYYKALFTGDYKYVLFNEEMGVLNSDGIHVGLPGGKVATGAYQLYLAGSKNALPGLTNVTKEAFSSFSSFKRVMGPAGPGQAWHHIVEQTPANIAKFGAEAIHNLNNLVRLPHGAGTIHSKISGYYSSIRPFSEGKTVRQWLSSKGYEEQYDFGIKMLKKFGWTE